MRAVLVLSLFATTCMSQAPSVPDESEEIDATDLDFASGESGETASNEQSAEASSEVDAGNYEEEPTQDVEASEEVAIVELPPTPSSVPIPVPLPLPVPVVTTGSTGACPPDAGFLWCAAKSKCLRAWEEPCPEFGPVSRTTAPGGLYQDPRLTSSVPPPATTYVPPVVTFAPYNPPSAATVGPGLYVPKSLRTWTVSAAEVYANAEPGAKASSTFSFPATVRAPYFPPATTFVPPATTFVPPATYVRPTTTFVPPATTSVPATYVPLAAARPATTFMPPATTFMPNTYVPPATTFPRTTFPPVATFPPVTFPATTMPASTWSNLLARPATGCLCGQSCAMTGGGLGVCQADRVTCAVNIMAPNCGMASTPAVRG